MTSRSIEMAVHNSTGIMTSDDAMMFLANVFAEATEHLAKNQDKKFNPELIDALPAKLTATTLSTANLTALYLALKSELNKKIYELKRQIITQYEDNREDREHLITQLKKQEFGLLHQHIAGLSLESVMRMGVLQRITHYLELHGIDEWESQHQDWTKRSVVVKKDELLDEFHFDFEKSAEYAIDQLFTVSRLQNRADNMIQSKIAELTSQQASLAAEIDKLDRKQRSLLFMSKTERAKQEPVLNELTSEVSKLANNYFYDYFYKKYDLQNDIEKQKLLDDTAEAYQCIVNRNQATLAETRRPLLSNLVQFLKAFAKIFSIMPYLEARRNKLPIFEPVPTEGEFVANELKQQLKLSLSTSRWSFFKDKTRQQPVIDSVPSPAIRVA